MNHRSTGVKMGKTFSKVANSLLAFTLATIFSLAAAPTSMAADICISGFEQVGDNCEMTVGYSQGVVSFTVPANLGKIQVELFGGAGGFGGLDCGNGCVKAPSGNVGHLLINSTDLTGETIVIYPGDQGKDGLTGASGNGGGQGGTSVFSANLNGGRGGNAGSTGSSGAGGGGGAATLVGISSMQYVAAGAGGGGGSANSPNGSTAGNTDEKYLETNYGGNGLSSSCNFYCDGGGGGGGGGGLSGGAGGQLYQAPNGDREAAGFGGSAGTNTPVGTYPPTDSEVTASDFVAPQGAGKAIIRYTPVLGALSLQAEGETKTASSSISFVLTLKSNRPFTAKDINLSGTATLGVSFKKTITNKPKKAPYVYKFTVAPTDPNENINGTLIASVFDVTSQPVLIDQSAPQATITLQPSTAKAASHIYDVRFDEEVLSLSTTSFKPAIGTAKSCKVGSVIGSGKYFQVALDNCTDGTFGLILLRNAASDALGNLSPDADLVSELTDKKGVQTTVQVSDVVIPT